MKFDLPRRIRHLRLAGRVAPHLGTDPERRALFMELMRFCKSLRHRLQAPLPAALQGMTPVRVKPTPLSTDTIREIADLAALIDRRSPYGLCLRRSLTRYFPLRRAGLPVVVRFGARMTDAEAPRDRLTGHAWLTLYDQPYFERDEDWERFRVVYSYPAAEA